MKDINMIYTDLIHQKREAEARLTEYQKKLEQLQERKSNIIIKKINGDLYYYSQHRENGKVVSKYLGAVKPGSIVDEEKKQMQISDLSEKVKNLKLDIESLEQMIKCYIKRKKQDSILDNFSFEVYWKDDITARVYVRGKNVTVSKYTENPGKQLFAEKKMTRYQLGKIFEMRCWEKGRADINEILENLGLKEYNPYEIVRKTHGVSDNDYIWFRFPGEQLTSKDVLVRD